MRKDHYDTKRKRKPSTLEKLEKIHPHKMLLYLAMIGSGIIFLFMIIAYSATKTLDVREMDVFIPKAFILSTLLIITSSFTLQKVLPAFESESFQSLRFNLGLTLILGCAFTFSQYFGWKELHEEGVFISGHISGSYLYLLSGLHLLHVIFGLAFLLWMYSRYGRAAHDPIKRLIMVTTPYEKIKLQMLSTFWHFMDILWVILFFYFLITL